MAPCGLTLDCVVRCASSDGETKSGSTVRSQRRCAVIYQFDRAGLASLALYCECILETDSIVCIHFDFISLKPDSYHAVGCELGEPYESYECYPHKL